MSYQQLIIVGNVGRDPEFKYLPSGTAVAQFTLASNERWNDKQTNETKEKTTWFRVSVYGQQAQTINEYVRKGRQVMVIGTIEGRAYMDNNNQPAVSLEVRARDVRFLGTREGGSMGGPGGGGNDEYSGGGGNNYGDNSKSMDDVPF